MVLVEFTIEPFVDGQPGAHVTAAIAAAEAIGATVEVGPFGTSCTVPDDLAGDLASAVVAAALAHGASHVTLHAAQAGQ